MISGVTIKPNSRRVIKIMGSVGCRSRMTFYDAYEERTKKKLVGWIYIENNPQYFLTPSRPVDFEQPLEVKTKLDNWFDENRVFNEGSKDYLIRRAIMYGITGFLSSFLVIVGYVGLKWIYKHIYHPRAIIAKDSYMVLSMDCLPKSSTKIINYFDRPIIIRRLSLQEVSKTQAITEEEQYNLCKDERVCALEFEDTLIVVLEGFNEDKYIPTPTEDGFVSLETGRIYDMYGRCLKQEGYNRGKNLKNMFASVNLNEERLYINEPDYQLQKWTKNDRYLIQYIIYKK